VEPVEGLINIDAEKSKAQAIRVVEEIHNLDTLFGWDYSGLMQFLATLPTVPWFQPQGPPNPAWRVFRAPTLAAAREAAREAARIAARAAALEATWEATWEAAREAAWEATWEAAWEAAWAAAREAAWEANGEITETAAMDAAQVSVLYVCTGLPLEARHRQNLLTRWDVWRQGYGLLCERDGVLYVYSREDT
jgi:hypothetical protein